MARHPRKGPIVWQDGSARREDPFGWLQFALELVLGLMIRLLLIPFQLLALLLFPRPDEPE